MTKKTRAMDNILALAAANNLKVISVRHSKHLRVELQRPDGTTGMVTHPINPGCPRALKNQKAHFKAFAQIGNHHMQTKKD